MSSSRHETMMKEALKAGGRREYQRAAELLLTLVSETDDFPQAYLYLGRSYHAIGRYERAIQFLHYFTEIEPDAGAGFFFLGRAYFSEGFYDEALTNLHRADLLDSDNPQTLGLLGLAYLKRRHSDVAVEYLGRAVELDPENRPLYAGYLNTLTVDAIRRFRHGDFDMSRQMLEFLVQQGVSNTLSHLYLASSYKELGRFQEALEHYDWVIEHEQPDPVLKLQRADVLLRMGNAEHARQMVSEYEPEPQTVDTAMLARHMAIESFQQAKFRKAIEFAKGVLKSVGPDYEMHLLLGDAFRQIGAETKAINHFRRATAIGQRRLEPRYGLILCYWQIGDYEKLASECRTVDSIASDDPIASYYLALAICRLGYPTSETIPGLEREMDRSGADPYLCTSLAGQYVLARRIAEAERLYRQAIDLSESHRPAYDGLFHLYSTSVGTEKAADLYHSYFEQFPDDTDRRRDYIQLLVSLQRYEHAVEQIQLQLPYEGSSQKLRRLLAFCYREIEKYREAAIVYRQLLKEEPDSEGYLRSLCYCLDRAGNRERALLLLERAFAYRKPTTELRLIQGVLLYREERLDEALEVFRAVLDDSVRDWRPYRNVAEIYRRRGMVEMAERYDERARELRIRS